MNHVSSSIERGTSKARTLADRVSEATEALGCERVWARPAGPHVLLGRDGGDAFARITPIGPGAYGLSFRSNDVDPAAPPSWDAVLLIDALVDVVEHALVGEGALPSLD